MISSFLRPIKMNGICGLFLTCSSFVIPTISADVIRRTEVANESGGAEAISPRPSLGLPAPDAHQSLNVGGVLLNQQRKCLSNCPAQNK
ncbi:hypothetical protein J6590_011529 [Homalodisca vitripennis]|nr:hypothetical protein J6590_011529 [Homalodisca vitripennis]